MTRLSTALAAGLLAAGTTALAQPVLADLAEIDRAVAQFTGAPQGAPGGAARPVDRRLRLAACAGGFALDWYGARRDTVQVTCPQPGGWKLFVPLTGGGAAAAAPLVQRGDAVTITLADEGFALSQPGEALESGAKGAWIKVRGASVGAAVLRAQVVRPGLVAIPLGNDLP